MRYFLSLILSLPSILLFAQKNAELRITHLTGDFYIFTSYKAYKGIRTPANGMYLVTDKGVAMIDAPWNATQFQPLLDSIQNKHRKKVVLAIATHSHEDRSGGLEFLRNKGVKTYSSKRTDEIAKLNHEKRAEFTFDKDTTFSLGKYKFSTFFAGEGHTKDNIVIWFNKDQVLYGGCLIKSTDARDLGFTGEANLVEWPLAIKKIQQKFKNPKFIIPGHEGWNSLQSLNHTLKLLAENKK